MNIKNRRNRVLMLAITPEVWLIRPIRLNRGRLEVSRRTLDWKPTSVPKFPRHFIFNHESGNVTLLFSVALALVRLLSCACAWIFKIARTRVRLMRTNARAIITHIKFICRIIWVWRPNGCLSTPITVVQGTAAARRDGR